MARVKAKKTTKLTKSQAPTKAAESTQNNNNNKKVSFSESNQVKQFETESGYESYDEDVASDEDDEMMTDNQQDNVQLQQLNLTVIAGTYNSNLLGWNYLLETRLDFDHIIDNFVQAQNNEDENDENSPSSPAQEDNEEDEDNDEDEDGEDNEEETAQDDEDKDDIDQMIDDDLDSDEQAIQMSQNGQTEVLKPSFAVKPHTGSINCVTSNGKFMVSGGFDENLVVYNLKTRRDSGVIHHTQGSITCMSLFDHFLFVGSSQGTLSVYYQSTAWPKIWEIEAHANNSVKALAVHPSGKLVMTLGETDHRLRLWNMLNGTLLQTISLGMKTFNDVQWSPSGDSFAVLQRHSIDVFLMEDCQLVASVPLVNEEQGGDDSSKKKLVSKPILTCFKYLSEQVIAVGTAEGVVQIINLQTQQSREIANVHKSRIKALDGEAVNIGEFALVSVCSAGVLSVHRVSDEFIFQEAVTQVNMRFTCVSLNHDPAVRKFVEERYEEFEAFLGDD